MKKLLGFTIIFLFPVMIFAQQDMTVPDSAARQFNMKLNLKVASNDGVENLMDSSADKTVYSGHPVRLNLKGSNFRAAIQLTVFSGDNGSMVLLAQSTVYCKGEKEHVVSTVKSIPINFGEKILFFPLGVLKSEEENKYNCLLEIDITQFQSPVSTNP